MTTKPDDPIIKNPLTTKPDDQYYIKPEFEYYEFYSWLSRLNTTRGSCTSFVTVVPAKVNVRSTL